MKIKEGLLGFSSSEYREKISDWNEYHPIQLAHNIYKKRRAIIIATGGVATGLATAHLTGGVSLVGSAWSGRNFRVEQRKLGLLEKEWENRGFKKLPSRDVKDVLIPVIIATTVGALTFAVDMGLANAVAQTAMYPVGSPLAYPYNVHAVGLFYQGVEQVVGRLGR
ncbi:hypothetical protein C8F04DRAFT_1228705 [Mycena alexandri]|uniref:Uncharacterized protein n=1 Tax=Mycena alexandri TaxID=1745969 RepID=A0AAD6X9S0_9AGAR|nr:hypothetical protein C8F04DRAFT_1228705 [Mycena alexandri]